VKVPERAVYNKGSMFFPSGWAPQTFTSSRKHRAELKKQSIYSFLDEEDIKVHDALLSYFKFKSLTAILVLILLYS
jgi:hypothetical protein